MLRQAAIALVALALAAPAASAADDTHPTTAQFGAARQAMQRAIPRIRHCISLDNTVCMNRAYWATYTPARTMLYGAATHFAPSCKPGRLFVDRAAEYLATLTVGYAVPSSRDAAIASNRAWAKLAAAWVRAADCSER